MNRRMVRSAVVLAPLGAAAVLLGPRDSGSPAWLVAPVLLLAVRLLAGAFDRMAGRPASVFLGEEAVLAAPFVLRLAVLFVAPDGPGLWWTAAFWAGCGLAAYSAQALFRKRAALGAFTATLCVLGGTAAWAGLSAALALALLSSVLLIYAVKKRGAA